MTHLQALYALYFLWIASEIIVFRRDRQEGTGARSDGFSRPAIFLAIGLAIFIAFGTLTHSALPLTGGWPRWAALGFAVWLAGTLIRQRAVRWLGEYFRTEVTILDTHKLITDGPYARLRHPSYTGALLACAGIGLAYGDGLAFLAMAVLPGLALAYRIRVEEKALASAFGTDWSAYRARTRALVPGLW